MILNKIFTFFEPKTFQVIQIDKEEGYVSYRLGLFSIAQEQLQFESSMQFDSFDKLAQSLVKSNPILVTITGTSIVNKSFSGDDYFATLDRDRFYYQKLKENDINYISFAKKSIVKEQISQFVLQGYQVLQVQIGPFAVGGLSQFISNDTKVQSGVFVFEFVNSSLEKFSISPNKEYFGRLQIENEIINAKDLLLYASIIEMLYPNKNFDNDISELTTEKEEIIYLNIFNKLGISVLIILLFSLFASYLVLDNYTQKNVALQKSIYELRKSNNQILAYKNSIAVKERIINKVGISNKYLHSYILHQLVKDMPNDVVLDKLHLHPLYKKTSKKRNYQTNLISITGQTTKIASFNNWILNLKQQKWVKNISIDSYKKSKKGYDIFKIIIHKNQNVL